MAKIEINTDLMQKELLPLVSEELKTINDTLSSAQEIYFPDSSLGWGNIISNISDCVRLANKYNNWVNRIHSSFTNNINENLEILNNFKTDDIKRKGNIVK